VKPSPLYKARLVPRPNVRFLVRHPAHVVALGFGVGLIPFAPGTFGTLLALPLFAWLHPRLQATDFLILLGALYLIGVWCCDRTGRDLGVEDHKAMVWDETVAFLAILFFTPPVLLWQAFAFLLFRLFDILKPGPVRYVERLFRGGFGVMIDDLLAAFITLLCLALYKIAVSGAGGVFGPGVV
jgi:phosphatidylglycerophosphatase A